MKSEKDIKSIIESTDSVEEAAAQILTEGNVTAPGATVTTVHEDESFPYQGIKGRVVGPAKNGQSGFVDVAYPNGVTVPIQSSLLVTP